MSACVRLTCWTTDASDNFEKKRFVQVWRKFSCSVIPTGSRVCSVYVCSVYVVIISKYGGNSLVQSSLTDSQVCSVCVYVVIISKYATKMVGTKDRQVACILGRKKLTQYIESSRLSVKNLSLFNSKESQNPLYF